MKPGRTPQDLVAEVVSAVLGTPTADVLATATLFDLPGFDSLAVVSVLDRLETELHVEVPPELIVPEAFESVDSILQLLAQTLAPRCVPGGHS
ncbi:MAG TPA: acyl carrier protein [Pseudonocardiaceae bacterium]|nr:acyl carrier protein [Pseudonocardiaceae bacterium]